MAIGSRVLTLACAHMVPPPGLQRALARFIFVVVDGQNRALRPHEP